MKLPELVNMSKVCCSQVHEEILELAGWVLFSNFASPRSSEGHLKYGEWVGSWWHLPVDRSGQFSTCMGLGGNKA